MKRLATSIVIALCTVLGAAAQQDSARQFRFAYLSYEKALKSMSGYSLMEQQMADVTAQYEAEMKRVEEEFNRKYEEFLEGQREFPKTILQKRQTELQELMTKNIAFRDSSRQELVRLRKEALAPLRLRLSDLLQKIGLERGYAFIIDTDVKACPFIHPGKGDDINQLVQDALK